LFLELHAHNVYDEAEGVAICDPQMRHGELHERAYVAKIFWWITSLLLLVPKRRGVWPVIKGYFCMQQWKEAFFLPQAWAIRCLHLL